MKKLKAEISVLKNKYFFNNLTSSKKVVLKFTLKPL